MNTLFLQHTFDHTPDTIVIKLNDRTVYLGPANVCEHGLEPRLGMNTLEVCLLTKSPGNFVYANGAIEFDSMTRVKELVIEDRYFRSLLHRCGVTMIDKIQNPEFPQDQLPGSTVLTMQGSCYCIEFEYPIKGWMQWHKHHRTISNNVGMYQEIKKELECAIS